MRVNGLKKTDFCVLWNFYFCGGAIVKSNGRFSEPVCLNQPWAAVEEGEGG